MRPLLAFLGAAIVLLVAYLLINPTVEWHQFEERFQRATLGSGQDVRTIEISSTSPGKYTIPFWIRAHPRHWFTPHRVVSGFPNLTQLTIFAKGAQRVTCLVFYLDSYASMIVLEYSPASAELAQFLESRLRSEFTGLPVKMKETSG